MLTDFARVSCNLNFTRSLDPKQIFSYLTPIDLLHLSWTSKGLHNLLTTDDLASVWKKARTENILKGIPDCPDGIKESQYTNLMFGDHCFVRPSQRFYRKLLTFFL